MMTTKSGLEHFILVYDHAADKLIEEIPFGHDSDSAVKTYSDLEQEYRTRKSIEIVLVGSDSIETIKKTHANYFGYGVVTEPLLRDILSA
jgi:hypothetical protein